MSKEAKKLVLLDAHAVIHRAYHALPDFVSSKGEPTGGIYGLSSMLLKIINDLKPDYLIAAYDLPGPTYRHEAYAQYKSGRQKADEALVMQLKRSRDVFKAFAIPIYDSPGFEADDIVGTIVEKMKKEKDVCVIIASGDMDTLQLVDDKRVQVYTLKKGISETIMYDEERVRERFGFGPEHIADYKGLSGDASDNISGVPGIGEKTATTLITKFGSIEEIIKLLAKDKQKFLDAGIKERIVNLLIEHEEEALFSKELATIRKDAPIHFSLPEKRWIETVQLQPILKLFEELEFRILGTRARDVLEKNGGAVAAVEPAAQAPEQTLSETEEKELKLAFSLLNPSIALPEMDDILRFAQTDSYRKAQEAIFTEIKKRNLDFVFEKIEKPLMPVLRKMEERGIKVDLDYLAKLSADFHKKLSALEKGIYREAGAEFNVNSPKQLGEILFTKLGLKQKYQKRTGTGALSTRESELEKLRELHPIISLILEYRQYQKLLSTYIDTIPVLVNPKDGRLHTTFVQIGAATGRMASRDPNLQNIPHKSDLGMEIRRAFVAEKGFKIVAIDYSQVELRIAAFLSGDEKFIDIFRRGEDVHSAVASEVFKVPRDKVSYEMRRHAKAINFGILYGMGVNSLKQALGTDRAEAQKFYDNYFQTFSTLASYLDAVKEEAHKKGYTQTFYGRRRYFEGLKSKLPYVRAGAERMAINAPIQGTEADIIKLAMIDIDRYFDKEKKEDAVRMLLQVHDELVFEIKEGEVKSAVPRIRNIMESVIDPKETKGVLCSTEAHVGDNWAQLKKIDS